MKYLVDANVLIQAHRDHYRFQLCPGFWDWLEQANQAGDVHSVERVYQELNPGDALANWAAANHGTFFLSPDEAVTNAMPTASQWAQSQPNYSQAARTDFSSAADFYLVAHALAHGLTVVTHEASAPTSVHVIKIPDACAGVNVPCMNPFDMLEAEGAQFSL